MDPDPASDLDASRRTWLAAERTWLAWWRTALGTAVAAIGVGSVLPHAVGGGRWAYAVLGVAYAALAVALFWAGAERQRRCEQALREGEYAGLDHRMVTAFTVSGIVLTLTTAVLVLIEA
jgi:putative membrane protein